MLARREFLQMAAVLAARPGVPGMLTRMSLLADAAVLYPGLAAAPPAQDFDIAQDARILRELAAREGLVGTASEADAVSFFEAISRRVMIGIHTYIPDEKDVEGWMERLIRLHDEMHAYWRELAVAYGKARPGADAFYDPGDAPIRAAAAARVAPATMPTPKSAYGRLLIEMGKASR